MRDADEYLEKFSKEVLDKAFEVRKQLEEDLNNNKKAIIDKREKEFAEAAEERIKDETSSFRAESNEAISRSRLEYKKKLLKEREEILNDVFGAAEQKVKEFVSSDKYFDWLAENAKQSVSSIALDNEDIIIFLNKSDEGYKERLSELLASQGLEVVLKIDETADFVGGTKAVCVSKGIEIDNSIYLRMENAKNDFLKTSGLSIAY